MSDQDLPFGRRPASGSVLAPGMVLSARYDILGYIGRGGMGLVYKAHDRVLDEVVALKLLLPYLLDNPSMRERFLSEIKLARRVTNRNVCRIHDYGEDGTLGYISMQFIDGVDLRTLIAQPGGLSVDEAYEIASQLADGLQAIHDEGIVHRDFKPANVMVDRRGNPRLMDFGIAKLWSTEQGLTTDGHIAGTPEYMSPEQAKSEPLDPRTDVYSLGIVLFELFTGTRPFRADNAVAVLHQHAFEEPPLDGPIAAAIPAAMKPVIRRALAKHRDARFSSANELKQALLGARAAPLPSPGTTESLLLKVQQLREPDDKAPVMMPRPRRLSRRGFWQLFAGASVAVIAAAGTWSILPRPSAEREPSGSPPASHVTTSQPAAPEPKAAAAATTTIQSGPAQATSSVPGSVHQREAVAAPCTRDEPESCRRACDAGDAAACTQLGVIYNRGTGVARDLTAATFYYERGCTGGDLPGCNNLGTIYQYGAMGLRGDRSKAASLYERACNGGHLEGCANLGTLYLDEPGASAQQRARGRELLRKACAAGLAKACRAAPD